jgi:hypothetical protein
MHYICVCRVKVPAAAPAAHTSVRRCQTQQRHHCVQELREAEALDEGTRHGCCLAIAELARRGLLPPARLQDVLPHITAVLHYDVQRGAHRCVVCNCRSPAQRHHVAAPCCCSTLQLQTTQHTTAHIWGPRES